MSATQLGAFTEKDATAKIREILFPVEKPKQEVQQQPEPVHQEPEAVEDLQIPEVAASESPATNDTQDDDGVDVSTLASWLGVDADSLILDDSGVKLKTKVDGTQGEANLAQLLKSYQLEATANRRLQELAEKRKAFESEIEGKTKAYAEKLSQADLVIQSVEKKMLEDFNKVDWNSLDDLQSIKMRMAFQERQAEVQNMRTDLQRKVGEFQSQQMKEFLDRYNETRTKEYEKLLEKVPDWRNTEKAKAEQTDMRSFLSDIGYSTDEMDGRFDQYGNLLQPGIIDHRFILLARDALAFRKLQSKAGTTKEVVKKAPKLIKPGASQSKADIQALQHKEQMDRVRKGSVKDAQEVIKRILSKKG